MTREIVKATPADAGCYVEGWWGQYAIAHMIERATEFGFEDSELEDIAARHLAEMGSSRPAGWNPITNDEYEAMHDGADTVEQWLNDNAVPEDYGFRWDDGEFYLRYIGCEGLDGPCPNGCQCGCNSGDYECACERW